MAKVHSPMQIMNYFGSLAPIAGIVAIAGGQDHSLFLRADGSLWGMGADVALGDGFTGCFYNGGVVVKPYSNYSEQILPRPPPQLVLARSSKTNLQLNATCLFGGAFHLLTSTNALQPFNQWTPVWTNTIVTRSNNNFSVTLTNSFDSSSAGRFYILQGE